jgi:hypothetical protein
MDRNKKSASASRNRANLVLRKVIKTRKKYNLKKTFKLIRVQKRCIL